MAKRHSIEIKSTLIYYDGPQLIIAEDLLGVRFLCVMIERNDNNDRYLCVPISTSKLTLVNSGALDVREVFERPETDEWYLADADFINSDTAFIEKTSQPDDDWLPTSGLFLSPHETPRGIIAEAEERQRAILHLSLTPPESLAETRISPKNLVDFLNVLQSLLKFAFRGSVKESTRSREWKKEHSDMFLMDVFAFSPGSFTIHLQSRSVADMFGHSDVAIALRKIDELTQYTDAETATKVMKNNRGHLASAYLKLLESIIKNHSPIKYSWYAPDEPEPVSRSISLQEALPLYEHLSNKIELISETFEIVGKVISANVESGMWKIRSIYDEREYSGRIDPSVPHLTLSGIVIESLTYAFQCREQIEEIIGTGKERKSLWLLKYVLISNPTKSHS